MLGRMSSLRQIRSAVATVPPLKDTAAPGLDLTGRQKHLLRETVTTLAPASGEVAQLFYRRLLELDPSLRRSLKGSLKTQARQFMGVLKLAILSLDDSDGLQPALNRLGTRRPRQRMAAGHCLTFSRALMWTFEQSLAEALHPRGAPSLGAAARRGEPHHGRLGPAELSLWAPLVRRHLSLPPSPRRRPSR